MTKRRLGDGQILDLLLRLHAPPAPRILDASYGHGRIWRGTDYQPTRLDIRAGLDVHYVADWDKLGELFPPASWDVVVWDPPHITDAGAGIVGAASWAESYGTRGAGLRADNIADLFGPFLVAARAVLQPAAGIVLVKIADQVHSGVQQLQFVDLVNAARTLGWRACDYYVKPRVGGIDDPKWKHRYHVRKPWSFWLVLRVGASCLGPGVGLAVGHRCISCGNAFTAQRRDARYCGTRCRKRASRASQKEARPSG